MAFLVSLSETFTAKVEVLTPNQNGSHDRTNFKAIFKRPTTSEIEHLTDFTDYELMQKYLAGFADLPAEGGGDVESTPENVAALLSVPEAVFGLSKAFLDAVLKGRQKN